MPVTLIEQKPNFVKRVEGEDKLAISEMFADTIQGEGVSAGLTATFIRLQGCTLQCVWCFDENTIIVKKIGNAKIKNLKKGEVLLTLDEKQNIVETTVQDIITREVSISEMMSISCDNLKGSPIVCTKDHPFYIKNRGWIQAKDLNLNDIIISVPAKQMISHKAVINNNQKNPIFFQKRLSTQKVMRGEGLIKPYIRSEEQNKHLSELRKGDKNPMKNPETARKNALSHFKKQSKLEEKFEQVFRSNNIPIKYVGNNQVSIGDKKRRFRFPDFIVEGANKVIEIYDTTYNYIINGERRKRDSEWENSTREHYEAFGYEVLFLNQKDLKNVSLQDRLFNFVFNGSVITNINTQLSDKQKAVMYGSKSVKKVKVVNLSCAPYNTYLLHGKYHHKWVHNCDTLDVWPEGNEYSFKEILDMLEPYKYKYLDGQRLILTGGSPIKQQVRLIGFIKAFIERFSFLPTIEVENEAVLIPHNELIRYVAQWNNSPKLANSGMKPRVRLKPDVIRAYSELPNSWFKFVIANENEWEEIVADYLPHLDFRKVILMPEGVTQEELNKNREFVADMAIKHGVRFSDRLHVTIWNKKTGV